MKCAPAGNGLLIVYGDTQTRTRRDTETQTSLQIPTGVFNISNRDPTNRSCVTGLVTPPRKPLLKLESVVATFIFWHKNVLKMPIKEYNL